MSVPTAGKPCRKGELCLGHGGLREVTEFHVLGYTWICINKRERKRNSAKQWKFGVRCGVKTVPGMRVWKGQIL